MPRTVLNMSLGCHAEEYMAFIDSPDVIGMGSRIQPIHTTGTLKTGRETLDCRAYKDALGIHTSDNEQRPILIDLLESLLRMEDANRPTAAGYDKRRHFRPEYLSCKSVELFCERFNKMTMQQ